MIRETSKRFNLQSYMCDASLFRKIFLMLLSFEMIAFLDVISLVFKCIVLCWGFFVLIHNYFIEKRAFKVKYKCFLWLFLFTMVVTSFVHMSIWFVPNIVLVFFTAICFFMFYGMYTDGNHEKIESEMVFVLKFFIYFGTICAILSFLILFWKHEMNICGYNLGIYENRLIGIYTNSNILAFSMIQSIISCDILSDPYISNKYKKAKINFKLLILCTIICCICLFLSDSNASFLFLIIYVTIRVFCNIFFRNKSLNSIRFFRTITIILGFCIVIMSTSFSMRNMCQNIINQIMTESSKESIIDKNDGSKEEISEDISNEGLTLVMPITSEDDKEEVTEIHIGREHYEVSSGRITLFKQGIEIFKHNPILGIGRANLTLYGKRYLKNGLIHPDLHNGYLTILVCYGLVGFLIFVVFSFLVARDVCKHMFVFTSEKYFGVFSRLFSCLVAYCGYCFFEKAILFDMTFMVGFFWSMLGYVMSYILNLTNVSTLDI